MHVVAFGRNGSSLGKIGMGDSTSDKLDDDSSFVIGADFVVVSVDNSLDIEEIVTELPDS